MKAVIEKSEVRGTIAAPPSKSYTIRGLMCAALARGESQIVNPLLSDDTGAAINVLSQIGVGIRQEKSLWQVKGGDFHEPDSDLFCGDSAATLRFMTAICSLISGRCRLVAGPSLSKRPIEPLIQALRKLGVNCSSQNGVPPVTIESGSFKGGRTELLGDISSQFVSALLLISPFAEKSLNIRLTTPLESKPYVLMTLNCMEKFGIKVKEAPDRYETTKQTYRPTKYIVEGDWSSASYFLALGAASGEVEVNCLNPKSFQGDRIMLNFLKDMGGKVAVKGNSVLVKKSRLTALKADLSDCIDLLPTMSALAAVAEGVSEFSGIERARLKESNRVAAIREGLQKMGISVTEGKDRLRIIGSKPKGAVIDSKGDHRMAMAFSVLGIIAGGTIIDEAECVAKTFPQFWDILKGIGGRVNINEQ